MTSPLLEELQTEIDSGRTIAAALEPVIRKEIINGTFAPGSKLALRDLAERYQAGVIPLREALSRLCASGFVDAVDQKGFRVAEVSLEELADITRTRQEIDRLALVEAIRRRDPEWESRVIAAHYRLNQIPQSARVGKSTAIDPAWERAHDEFHSTLVSGCQSAWLRRFSETLHDQTARYRHLSVAAPRAVSRDVKAEHDAIVNAIVSRDVELACRLLGEHFASTGKLVLEALEFAQQKSRKTRTLTRKRT
jgi:GntR family transcriptional regulator, carbon starvation induced regulator